MDIETLAVSLDGYRIIFDETVKHEELAECIVNDSLPDVSRILEADGQVLMRSKGVEAGRMTVGCSMAAWVLYVPEDGAGPCTLKIRREFSIISEIPEADKDCRASASVYISDIDARMLNSRKISLRASINAPFRVWQRHETVLASLPELQDNLGLHILNGAFNMFKITNVNERAFAIALEHEITGQAYISEIVGSRVTAAVDDIRSVGTKQIIRGSATVTTDYIDNEGSFHSISYNTGFSQLVETDAMTEGGFASAVLTPTGLLVESDTGDTPKLLKAQLNLVAQLTVGDNTERQFISDAYSTKHDTELKTTRLMAASQPRCFAAREFLQAQLNTAVEAQELVKLSVRICGVRVTGDELVCGAAVSAIYRGVDDALWSCHTSPSITVNIDLFEGETAQAQAACEEAFTSISGDTFNVRIPVVFTISASSEKEVEAVTGLKLADEPKQRQGRTSLTLKRYRGDCSIWDLAKGFDSTTEAIDIVNDLNGNQPECGELLLIPTFF